LIRLDPFYPIVPDAAWVARLAAQGAKLIQLRVKNGTPEAIEAEIARALETASAHGCQLVVNDYWQAAIDLGCDYVHLGQEDLDDADLPAIRRAGIKLGVSTHDEAELERGLATQPDYVALGPIYPTILKKMPFAPQGLERLGAWKRRIGAIPLVGIGGVSLERAPGVLESGADSAAVVTDITLNPDPEARTRAWATATRPYIQRS